MKNIFRLIAITMTLLGPGAAAEAQQPKKVPRVGYLSAGDSNPLQVQAFRQGLRDLGYIEGTNVSR